MSPKVTTTVLFREKNWEILADSREDNEEWSIIKHFCTRIRTAHGWVPRVFLYPWDFKCPNCDAIAPDDIQTLWQMHNFDRPDTRREDEIRLWPNPLTAVGNV